MRVLSGLVILLAFVVGGAAQAAPLEKATAQPFAVKLDWASPHRTLNALRVDCRISNADGQPIGRGSVEARLDPAFLSRRGSMEAVLPAVLYPGADPDAAMTCDCRVRFDVRSPFFRSGTSRFGQLPWMFARPIRFSEAACAPIPRAETQTS